MAYFMAGVANAEIFKGNDLFATAKTLTDSSITIGVTGEDVKAGQGAMLYGKYFHSATMGLKMTDAMFRLEYIAANVGSEIELGGDVFCEEEIEIPSTDSGEPIELAKIAVPFLSGSNKIYAYIKKAEDTYYITKEVIDNKITLAVNPLKDTKYCVKYLYTNESARKITINANFTPDTLSVYLTAPLFAGDAADPSTGTKVGSVTIKIPRFLLSGSQELTMNMTGASTTAFEGSALAANPEGCEGNAIYAEIIEVIKDRTLDNATYIIENSADGIEIHDGETIKLKLYACMKDSMPILVDNSKFFWNCDVNSQKGPSLISVDSQSGVVKCNCNAIKDEIDNYLPTSQNVYVYEYLNKAPGRQIASVVITINK